nr:polysaccharide deacetylase family protein [Kofleriaceae bacterium]
MRGWLLAAVVTVACQAGCQSDIDQVDSAYSRPDEHRAMHCSIDIDAVTRNDDASIDGGLDRARDRGEILELFAHDPGATISWDTVEHLLAGAQARGLNFVTYADLANGTAPPGGGLAFAFDDDHVAAWMDGEAMFAQYGARLTFFLTRYARLQPEQKADMAQLAADGHDLEPHSVKHLRGPEYVDDFGLAAYLGDEVQPSLDVLEDDGYTLTTYAYPFGARTDETDRAILARGVTQLRSVALTWGAPAEAPCPL